MSSNFSKKESYLVHISFYATRGWNRQVIPDRVNQWSATWIIFLWCPIIVPLVCTFSPSLRMITLKPLPLCSSRSHKYNNYDKATYIRLGLWLGLLKNGFIIYEIPNLKNLGIIWSLVLLFRTTSPYLFCLKRFLSSHDWKGFLWKNPPIL